ncbi:element excision factor XisI family protein [uncultured Nostoc sp.]|uniref:element excision factor XisI family protein n=1 Tax=uncultured Nostoc sp. TaxID=340711 RepID=UPI0035CC1A99
MVFDRTRVGAASPKETRYLWMDIGWDSERRIHGCLVHIDLIDGKLWILTGWHGRRHCRRFRTGWNS